MNQHSAVRSSGFVCGSISVPSFDLQKGSIYGVSIPVGFGEDWVMLMQTLTGERRNSNIIVPNSGLAICPQLGLGLLDARAKVNDVLGTLGYGPPDYPLICDTVRRVNASTTIEELPATSRLLVELLNAKKMHYPTIVLSTAGLDPAGIKLTQKLLTDWRATTLHLFATSLSSYYNSYCLFRKVVQCTAA